MKLVKLAATLLLISATATPAIAQGVPEDVHCLVLSNAFSKGASDPKGKQIASETLVFFLGRLDGRASSATIVSAMRAQVGKIDPKTAPTEMRACAARFARAGQAIQAMGKAAQPAK